MFLLMKNEYTFRTCLILPLFSRKGKREDTANKEMVKIFKPDPKEAGTIGQIEVQAAPFLGHFHGENPHSPEISPLLRRFCRGPPCHAAGWSTPVQASLIWNPIAPEAAFLRSAALP